jgi:hypothetical protein
LALRTRQYVFTIHLLFFNDKKGIVQKEEKAKALQMFVCLPGKRANGFSNAAIATVQIGLSHYKAYH